MKEQMDCEDWLRKLVDLQTLSQSTLETEFSDNVSVIKTRLDDVEKNFSDMNKIPWV